jgi:hypothetical protein
MHLWQLKTVIFLYMYLMHAFLLVIPKAAMRPNFVQQTRDQFVEQNLIDLSLGVTKLFTDTILVTHCSASQLSHRC